jgi:hypothetical protein
MSVPSIGSSLSQSVTSQLLQQLLSEGTSSQTQTGAGALGDLLSLSPAAQQLNQAPTAVSKAMSDLLTDQKDVQGDLAQLKGYFQQNPQALASLLGSLQGGSSTYSNSGNLGSSGSLLTTLLNAKQSGSDSGALLAALLGNQTQDPLLASLNNSDSGSSADSLSFLG